MIFGRFSIINPIPVQNLNDYISPFSMDLFQLMGSTTTTKYLLRLY